MYAITGITRKAGSVLARTLFAANRLRECSFILDVGSREDHGQ